MLKYYLDFAEERIYKAKRVQFFGETCPHSLHKKFPKDAKRVDLDRIMNFNKV